MIEKRILVVDDDPKIRVLLRRCLEGDGYEVSEAHDMTTTMAELHGAAPDLITLDLQLGVDDGYEVAQRIRKTSQVPIIMVTGKNDVIDRVVGLEIGADDYITKPFHIREVLARVKTVLRRSNGSAVITETGECGCAPPCSCQQHEKDDVLCFDGMQAAVDKFQLLDRDGSLAELTSGDFKLLKVFLLNPKRVLSREMLMDSIGGVSWAPLDRTIDNQVARLRKKIERDPSRPRLITTVRGVGYTFSSDVQRASNHAFASIA